MKYVLTIIVAVLLVGCDSTSEQAPNNLKKGDQYFATKEYEVASYYYEKIPEDSPLYKEAQMKLQQIDDIEKGKLPKISAEDEARKVSVFDQSITSNALGKMPVHTVSLNNESVYKLVSVVLEFTYFDAGGNVIAVKRDKVVTPIPRKSQGTFKGIAPGVLDDPCTSSKVKVLSAEFQ
jgi:hypothetical protein